MLDEQFRDTVLFVEHPCHGLPRNPHKRAICHRDGCFYAQRLTGEASLAEEITGFQKGDNRFLALFGCYREHYLASTDVEHGIRRLSLPEDVAVRTVFQNGLSTV